MDITVNVKEIYEHLEDDLSREIFENRLLHSLISFPANHSKFVYNIISASPRIMGSVNKLIAALDNDVIFYGAGFYAKQLITYLRNTLGNKFKIAAICDSDEKKWGIDFLGYSVISPQQLQESYSNAMIIITTSYYNTTTKNIQKFLLNLGFSENQIWAFFSENQSQYFDNDILSPDFLGDEVFIDAGCFDFNSSVQFTKWCGTKYKKIIAFEPDPDQYPVCIENSKDIGNVTIHPYGLWNENAELCFKNDVKASSAHIIIDESNENKLKIKTVKLDDILNGEKATFIKMDIEGAELNALKGAEQTILKYHPKLAISLYHKSEDIWEIPAYILSLYNKYKFYLRHYSIADDETVLYAV